MELRDPLQGAILGKGCQAFQKDGGMFLQSLSLLILSGRSLVGHCWLIVDVVGGDNSGQLHLLHSSASKEDIFYMVVVENSE